MDVQVLHCRPIGSGHWKRSSHKLCTTIVPKGELRVRCQSMSRREAEMEWHPGGSTSRPEPATTRRNVKEHRRMEQLVTQGYQEKKEVALSVTKRWKRPSPLRSKKLDKGVENNAEIWKTRKLINPLRFYISILLIEAAVYLWAMAVLFICKYQCPYFLVYI